MKSHYVVCIKFNQHYSCGDLKQPLTVERLIPNSKQMATSQQCHAHITIRHMAKVQLVKVNDFSSTLVCDYIL